MNNGRTPTAVTVDEATRAQLEAIAKAKGISIAELARQMVSPTGLPQYQQPSTSPVSISDDFAEEMKRSFSQAMQMRMMASLGNAFGSPQPPPAPSEPKSGGISDAVKSIMERAMEMRMMAQLPKMLNMEDDEGTKKLMDATLKQLMDDFNAKISGVTKVSENTENAFKAYTEAQEKRAAEEKMERLKAEMLKKDEQHAKELAELRDEIQNALSHREEPKDTVAELSEMADKYERIVAASNRLKSIQFGGSQSKEASGGQKTDLEKAKELIAGINELASSGVEIASRVLNRGDGPQRPAAGMAAGGVPTPNYPNPTEAPKHDVVDPITEESLIIDRDTGNQYTLRQWREKFGSDPILVDPSGRPLQLPAPTPSRATEAPKPPSQTTLPMPKTEPEPKSAPQPEPEADTSTSAEPEAPATDSKAEEGASETDTASASG